MARLLTLMPAATVAALTWGLPSSAHEFDLSVDVRAVSSTAGQSRLTGGLGATRYGDDDQGLQLGVLRASYQAAVAETVSATLDAVSYGERSDPKIDITEAYLQWRPIPSSAWRSQVKLGGFYPDISLENRLRGWRSPYTLSSSAINAWIGEEVHAIGTEYQLDWLGRQTGHDVNLGVSVAAYGWTDPAGTVVAIRGWGLHDQQTGVLGDFGTQGQQPLPPRTIVFDDLDKRAGWYAGLNGSWRGQVEVRALHYDNRADPSIYSSKINDVGWLTRFNSLGVRVEPDEQWTFIWQRLYGETFALSSHPNAFYYGAWFGLLSWQSGVHRVSARYDQFAVDHRYSNLGFFNYQNGHAWTAAYTYTFGDHWNVVLEGLWVDSTLGTRTVLLGLPDSERATQLQLAVRYEL